MSEQKKEQSEEKKFYSPIATAIATAIGGPLGAGYIISQNYYGADKKSEGKKALIITLLGTILITAALFMLPENIPTSGLAIGIIIGIYYFVQNTQGLFLPKFEENKKSYFSNWKAAGIGFISLIITFIIIFGASFLFPNSTVENQEYYDEMIEYSEREEESIVFYEKYNNDDDTVSLLDELKNISIPKTKENIESLKEINNDISLSTELLKRNGMLLEYTELRLKAFETFQKYLLDDTEKYFEELDTIHIEMESLLTQINLKQ